MALTTFILGQVLCLHSHVADAENEAKILYSEGYLVLHSLNGIYPRLKV